MAYSSRSLKDPAGTQGKRVVFLHTLSFEAVRPSVGSILRRHLGGGKVTRMLFSTELIHVNIPSRRWRGLQLQSYPHLLQSKPH